MLTVGENVMVIKVFHYVATNDMFEDFARNGGHRHWAIVCRVRSCPLFNAVVPWVNFLGHIRRRRVVLGCG